MWRGVVERGPLAVPSRMLKLQFIPSTLELGLKENREIKEVLSFPFQLHRFTRDHHIWRRAQEHYEFCFLLTRSTRSPSWFIYTHTMLEWMWNYHVQMHIQLHAILPFNACMWVCICKCVCTYVCVCVLRSVPLFYASVQKGLVPTTWCRAASAPPIPAWIATLAANQKLPAAFAVCPLSIFSNTSLNLLASLGCCIKTPHSTRSQIISFPVCIRATPQ